MQNMINYNHSELSEGITFFLNKIIKTIKKTINFLDLV